MMMTAVRMVHLPYRGKSLAVSDLLGGQAQASGSSIEYAKAGTVRPLALTTQARLEA